MNGKAKVVTQALASRQGLGELIVIAVVLAFGINLASSNIANYWESGRVIGLAGLVLIFLPVMYLLNKLRASLNVEATVNAVVALDTQNNTIIEIPGYFFSESLKKVFTAAFVEKEAYKNIWDGNPLVPKPNIVNFPLAQDVKGDVRPVTYSAVIETKRTSSPETPSEKLMVEAIEYLLIEQISEQLFDSFNQLDDSKSSIEGLTPQNIPPDLHTNRFLRLFTTPLEEREIYTKSKIQIPSGGILRSISGSDGSLYSSLVIYLPQKSSISRPHQRTLVLSSPRAKIEMTISYCQDRQTPPENFIELYLAKDPRNVALLRFSILLKVSVSINSLWNFKGWRFYGWADGIPNKILMSFDFSEYVTRINWSQVRAQARVNVVSRRLEEKNNRVDSKSTNS